MFRKSRKSSNTTNSNEPRFLRIESEINAEAAENGAFSVGSSTPKPLGFFSRLFRRSSETVVNNDHPTTTTTATTVEMRKKSIWQRSKSILRPRSTLLDSHEQHSNSTILSEIPIRGSGSAARLCYEDDAYEHYQKNRPIFDPDAFLTHIFAENDLMYAELKLKKQGITESEIEEQLQPTVSVITAMIDNPLSKVVDELLSCSQIINNEQPRHYCHFSDNPKLDSPLLPNSTCSEEYRDSADSESVRSTDSEYSDSEDSVGSFVDSLQSFNSGNYNLEGVTENSLDEMAAIFGQMKINDRPAQTLPDGTIRILVKDDQNEEGGVSVESIRFHDWTIDAKLKPKLRHCQSETLKMTEIGVNTTTQKSQKAEKGEMILAGRSASVSDIPAGVERREMTARRRTVSAKISEIVAFFEGGAIISRDQ